MFLNENPVVTIIDRPCGSGKTSRLLQSFKADERYLVVVPLLTEVERVISDACVPFVQPTTDEDYSSKFSNLEALLIDGLNVVTTHALFPQLAKLAALGLLRRYHVIMDEVPSVLEQVRDVTPHELQEFYVDLGYMTVNADGRVYPTQKWHDHSHEVHNVLDRKLYDLSTYGHLHLVNNKAFLWGYPTCLFTSCASFTVLTYLADGSELLHYLRKNEIDFIHDRDETLELAHRQAAKSLILVRDIPAVNTLNFSYSAQGKLSAADCKRVTLALRNMRRDELKDTPLRDILVCCPKDKWFSAKRRNNKPMKGPYAEQSKLHRDTTWLPNTTRGTNDHAHSSTLIYLYSQHLNPMHCSFYGIPSQGEDNKRYGLAELIQVIYRTRVRKGDPITVYIPCKRMRKLLLDYLDAPTPLS